MAAWMDSRRARVLLNTDHHTICRFAAPDKQAFVQIKDELVKMGSRLIKKADVKCGRLQDIPGQAPAEPHYRIRSASTWGPGAVRPPRVQVNLLTITNPLDSMRKSADLGFSVAPIKAKRGMSIQTSNGVMREDDQADPASVGLSYVSDNPSHNVSTDKLS